MTQIAPTREGELSLDRRSEIQHLTHMKHSACTFDCPDSCSWLVDPERKKIVGHPDHPFTKGFCCPKGARMFKRIDSPDRIIEPHLRVGSKFQPVSWDVALELCASKLDALRMTPEKILHLRGFGYRGILAHASVAFFKAIGATRTEGALCDDTGIEACIRDFGSLDHNDPEDILNARLIVNWGKDFNRSSIHMAALLRKARKNGSKVVSISIGGDDTASLSDHVIRIRPGTDRFLATAVIKLLLESNAIGTDTLNAVSGFDSFRTLLDDWSLDELLAACDARIEDATMLAEWYGSEEPLSAVIGWGVQRHHHGGESVRFINALSMLSGNVGAAGRCAYYNISSGRNYTKWQADGSHDGPTRTFLVPRLAAELEAADPKIEFCWIDGFNPVNQVPDAMAAAHAIKKIPFTVVVDGFMTDTAMRADLILPPAFTLEHEDILGSALHNYLNHSAKIVAPRGSCRTDFEILAELGGRLEAPVTFPEKEKCFRQALADSSISLEDLREKGFARGGWPQIAYEGMRFDHDDGRYSLPQILTPEKASPKQWPFILLTLVRKEAIHSQIPEEDQTEIPVARLSMHNPALDTIPSGSLALLTTPAGSMTVRVEAVEGIHPEAVIMRRGGWLKHGRNPNTVIEQHVTDMGGGAAYYSQRCMLLPVN